MNNKEALEILKEYLETDKVIIDENPDDDDFTQYIKRNDEAIKIAIKALEEMKDNAEN